MMKDIFSDIAPLCQLTLRPAARILGNDIAVLTSVVSNTDEIFVLRIYL